MEILRSAREVESMRSAWEQWQADPNISIDHFLLICRLRTNVHSPYVIVVREGLQPRAMLVARLEDGYAAPKIGYIKTFQTSGRSLALVYPGVLGEVTPTISEILVHALQETLRNREADVITLYQLPVQSPLCRAALRRTPWLWRDGQPKLSTHWGLTLPAQPGGLLKAMRSKHRSWNARKARELEQAFPGRVSFQGWKPGGDVDVLCTELESVACLTYQRGLGVGFRNDTEHRERFRLFNQCEALRAWTLRIDDKTRAFCMGFVSRDTFYLSEIGYDPAYQSYEVGTSLFLHMTDALIREGVAKLDFGFGDAHYKKRFGDRSWQEATLRLYSRSMNGFLARWSTAFADGISGMGRRLVERLGGVDRIKSAWRRRLSKQARALGGASRGGG